MAPAVEARSQLALQAEQISDVFAGMLNGSGVASMLRAGFGCLGCLTKTVLILLLGSVLVIAIDAVFTPWAFHFGGTTHLTPTWTGIGHLRASSGDYVLYVWFSPQPSRGSVLHLPYFTGRGYLCTPRGERYSLRATAGLKEHVGADTNGKEMNLTLYRRPWYYTFAGRYDDRPRLTFSGRWINPNLVMDDGGSLSEAFLPDGTLYEGPARGKPARREKVTLVLREAPWATWFDDCRAER